MHSGGSIPKDVNPHKYLSDRLIERSDDTSVRIGRMLNSMRVDRNKADYDDQIPEDLAKISSLVQYQATQVITDLKRI